MSQQVKSAFTAKQVNRRQFLATTAKAGCVMGLVGLGLTATAKSQGQLALKLAGRQVPLKKAIFSRPVCAAVYVLRLALRHTIAGTLVRWRSHWHAILYRTAHSLRDV